MSTSASSDPERPFEGTRPAKVVLTDFIAVFDDIIKHSGTTFPGWKGKETEDILLDTCYANGKEGRQYAIQIQGGPVSDTEKFAESMRLYWKSQGFSIGNIFRNPGVNRSVEINAVTSTGTKVLFVPSKGGSFIKVKSECSLDPAMKTPTSKL